MAQQIQKTTCPLDCPDACALEVTVEDGRLAEIKGRKEYPHTQGFICNKVGRFGRHVYAPERLLHPMKRVGPKGSGQFEPIAWNEAIATIAKRLGEVRDRWGGESILPFHYGGSNGLLSEELLDSLFFARLGASQLDKTICAAPTTAAAKGLYGKMPGVAFEDFPKAAFILIWGANPKATHIHLVPFLKEAKKNGATIVSVDPVRHFSDREVDFHLAVRPGTDLPVALAMIHTWANKNLLDGAFIAQHASGAEELLAAAQAWSPARAAAVSGVSESAIERLAEAYAAASPALIRLGWGMERNRMGARAAGAILAMPALLGKFGVPGGGYTLSNSGATKFNKDAVLGRLDWSTRTLNMTQLADHLTQPMDPPVKALFVYNANPAITVPDHNRLLRGLADEELFTVVAEQVHTDTCDFADILLPSTTFLEAPDLRAGYGNYVLGAIRPVLEPLGEARSNARLFSDLAQAMGFNDEPFAWDEERLQQKVLENMTLNNAPVDLEILAAGEQQHIRFDGGNPIQFSSVFPGTADGKVQFTPDSFGQNPYAWEATEDPDHPLALISPASGKLVTSSLGEFNLPELCLTLNPFDADSRGLTAGNLVRVHNNLGEVVCRLVVSDRVTTGVAHMPKGSWRKAAVNGSTASSLCPSHLEPISKGACFNDARVQVSAYTE